MTGTTTTCMSASSSEAHDRADLIGRGARERVVVDGARFDRRGRAKAKRLSAGLLLTYSRLQPPAFQAEAKTASL